MYSLWTELLLLVFACFVEVNGEENIWHLGIIYDGTFAHTEHDIWLLLEDLNARIPHLLCAVLDARVCLRLPKYKFTVGEYSLHEVCRQIELGVRSIISLTNCATAKQIEATSSQYHIPHFAIPDASCTRQQLVSNVKEFAWTNSALPWVVRAPEVLATALETIMRVDRISELLILSDGSSVIPPEILRRETNRLLSNKLATAISVQVFHTKANCNDPISCPGHSFMSILNQFKTRNTTKSVNSFPTYIFLFETKRGSEEIINSINDYELMNEDFFWVLAEQTDVAPLLQHLQSPVELPVDKSWKPNVAVLRWLPPIQTLSGAMEFISNKTEFPMDLIRHTTEQYPERMMSIAFLVFESTRAYVDIRRQYHHLFASKNIRCTTDKPTLFSAGVKIRDTMTARIKNSKVNQQLIFYATTTEINRNQQKSTQFIPTAVISDGNLTFTKWGKLILHETRKSGLFPNSFRGLHGRILRIGVVIDPPYVQTCEVSSKGQLINPAGLMIDLTQLLAERFQFRPIFYESSDQQYGAADKSGNWSGLIHDLLTGRIDIAAAPLAFTEDRAKVIRYLGPFMVSQAATLAVKLYDNASPFRAFRPFQREMWLLLITSIFLTGVILFLLNYFSPFSAWNLGLPDSSENEVSVRENIWSALSSFLLQGCEVYPLAPCARSAIISFWVMIVIFYATWQAFMTATMSRSDVKMPITTLDELAYSQSIIPVAPEGSSITNAFSVSSF
ncbi:hypothetical protein CRM22_006179 [Opisthorchis felineus]|uniref:Ionotropic glutamate receptor L-glutamate and glycine-binding domain-containing protein n=1 Tax=Opisthorchis felineus TaxID=147828 RepID=A0A4S2LNX7_OPIFE|nr:hypothetical protein CRM22_006179 [Opisthorchis felineus]